MKLHLMTAVLLSSALVVGCGGRDDDARSADESGTPAAATPGTDQPVAPAAPQVSAAPEPERLAPRETQPARPAPAPRPRTATRAAEAPAPRAEAPAAPARPVVRMVTIPANTALPLELTTAVSSETASVEMPVSARLRQDVEVDGVTVLPAGSVVRGEVIDVARAGRVQGRSRLGLRFTSVTIGDTRQDLRTNPVVFEGEATKGEDATKVGAGAGVGAVIGGILGGGSGAAKGAAIGGAAGAGAVLATRGRDIDLPVGSNVNATLASEVDVRVR
jgi:hypothetical protein